MRRRGCMQKRRRAAPTKSDWWSARYRRPRGASWASTTAWWWKKCAARRPTPSCARATSSWPSTTPASAASRNSTGCWKNLRATRSWRCWCAAAAALPIPRCAWRARVDGEAMSAGSAPPRLDALRQAARSCTACPLYAHATQTVFGAGSDHASVMLVGEQPGDREDIEGLPFVGPAGALLDRALEAAGVDRRNVYVTNAVKHFKWEPRGKRRLHKKPSEREIEACHPWLEGEIAALRPRVIVCLGATAASAVIGRGFKVSLQRGRFVPSALAPFVFATLHPSAVLRLPDAAQRETAFAA